MATKKVDDIKHDVRVLLGENEVITPLLSMETSEAPGSVATERDILTESMILSAIDNIHLTAPLEMLTDVFSSIDYTGATYNEKGYRLTPLASDFLRFVFCKSDKWDIPVSTACNENDEQYLMLHSRFAGIKASNERPAAAIMKGGGNLILETYPSVSTETMSGCYIKMAVYAQDEDSNDTVEIAERCYKALLYNIASLYYVSIKEEDSAKLMLEECEAIIGIDKEG